MLLPLDTWVPILDGDPHAAAMYERHYSAERTLKKRRARGTLLFLGPGEKLVLATPCRRALFAWRWAKKRADGQTGIECAVFRNEGAGVASDLVAAADAVADAKWPGERHFTYVNPHKVANSNAGRCFARAGWRYVYVRDANRQKRRKRSRRGLYIMERLPQSALPSRAAA